MLPQLELPVHIIELPVSKQKVKITPFVVKQEKSLLTSITENAQDNLEIFKNNGNFIFQF
jgi:hypothetical protein